MFLDYSQIRTAPPYIRRLQNNNNTQFFHLKIHIRGTLWLPSSPITICKFLHRKCLNQSDERWQKKDLHTIRLTFTCNFCCCLVFFHSVLCAFCDVSILNIPTMYCFYYSFFGAYIAKSGLCKNCCLSLRIFHRTYYVCALRNTVARQITENLEMYWQKNAKNAKLLAFENKMKISACHLTDHLFRMQISSLDLCRGVQCNMLQ